MADSLVSTGLVALAATSLLFLPACDPAVGDSDGSSSTSGGPSTSTTDPQTSGPPMTSSTTSGPPMTSSTTDTPTGSSSSSTSDTGSSSSTGVEGDCVDEDIGSAVGSGLASGTNEDQGDDFQLRYCDGGASTSSTSAGTTASTGGGPTGGGPTGGGGTTGFGDTGDFGTTGDFGDGDDYVISWTPPAAGLYVIDTFGSDIDTVLSVVPPECGASSTVCNDDCNDLQSGLVYEASDGETVYIVVEGYGGRRGSFVLNITESSELECESYGGSTGGGTTTVGTSVGTSAGTSPTGP